MFGVKLPYQSMQELNLDWILVKVKNILRFVPDDGKVGQILRRTRDGAEWSDGGGGAVDSVNGQTGTVVLDADDVGALPDTYVAPVTSVNGQTGAVVIPTGGAVDSVNGQTGTVMLDADDVGALPDTYVAPVTSVNGQTGAVVLDAEDIGAISGFGTQQFATTLPFTPDKDGFVSIVCIPNAATAYLYVRDDTDGFSAARGYATSINQQFTINFAVIAGHNYIAQAQAGVTITIIYTPFK